MPDEDLTGVAHEVEDEEDLDDRRCGRIARTLRCCQGDVDDRGIAGELYAEVHRRYQTAGEPGAFWTL